MFPKNTALAALAAIAVSGGLAAFGPTTASAAVTNCDVSADGIAWTAEELAFYGLLNDYRAANGVTPLADSAELSRAAQWMSDDSVGRESIHDDTAGRGPFQRVVDCGSPANNVSENVFGFPGGRLSAQEAFTGFRNSAAHNATMLRPDLDTVGIGLTTTAAGVFWTVDFATWPAGVAPTPVAEAGQAPEVPNPVPPVVPEVPNPVPPVVEPEVPNPDLGHDGPVDCDVEEAALALNGEEPEMFDKINELRAQTGLAPLEYNRFLARPAEWFSNDMAAHGASGSTDSLGRDISTRLGECGATGLIQYGELTFHGTATSVDDALAFWTNSASANAQLLDSGYTSIGLAVIYAEDGTIYWTVYLGH